MKLMIDINPEMRDWIVNGFPDNEDMLRILRVIKDATPLEECGDCVKREDVLETLRTMYDTHIIETEDGDEYIDYNDTVYEIEQLQPVQPKQRTGRWIPYIPEYDTEVEYYVCSECKNRCMAETRYCYECGAKMGGEQEWKE